MGINIEQIQAALDRDKATLRAAAETIRNPCAEIMLSSAANYKQYDNGAVAYAPHHGISGSPGQTTVDGAKIATATTITADRIIPGSILVGDTILSSWRNEVLNTSSGDRAHLKSAVTETLKNDFDESVWSLELPGVTKDEIDVFTVADMVYVDVKSDVFTNKNIRKSFQLAEGESVKSTSLELGILTVVIDRPAKRVNIEVK